VSTSVGLGLAFLLAIAQSTVVSQVTFLGLSPNLVLLFVLAWALLWGLREGLVVGLMAGFVLDMLSGAPFGLATAALVFASWLAGLGGLNVFRAAWVLPYLVAGLATLVYNVSFLLFLQLGGQEVRWGAALGRVVLPEALLNMFFMSLVYSFVRWLQRRLQPRPVEW